MLPIPPWVLAAVVVLLGSVCPGQVFEVGMTGGTSLMRNSVLVPTSQLGSSPSDVTLSDGFRLGFRMTFNSYRFFGHEIGYAYNRTQLDLAGQGKYGMAAHQGFYDFLVYAAPEGSKIRPFLAGGAQFTNFVPPGASVTSGGGATKFGLNYGGGVKARVGHMFMLRFDLRQYHSPKPDFFNLPGYPQGWLRQVEVSGGFSVVM